MIPDPSTLFQQRIMFAKSLDSQTRLSLLMNTVECSISTNVCRRCTQNATDSTNSSEPDYCSGCGGCCERVIPLTNSEITSVKKYLNSTPQLRKYILLLNKDIPLRMCPFLDYSQPGSKKCLIYSSSVLPLVCQHYTCNPERREKKLQEHFSKLNEPLFQVDMWHTFFEKSARAPDISEEWHIKDLLLQTHHATSVQRCPERLPWFVQNFQWLEFIRENLRLPIPSNVRTDKEALCYFKWWMKTQTKK